MARRQSHLHSEAHEDTIKKRKRFPPRSSAFRSTYNRKAKTRPRGSRQQRERGLLRTQRYWKIVEYENDDRVARDFAPTKPNAATLVANNPFLLDAPTPAFPGPGKLDYNAMHRWNLRMNGVSETGRRPF